jgi:hypothetical protein
VTPQEIQQLTNDQVRALLAHAVPAGGQGVIGPLHDIRGYIPMTQQTNPANFPPYVKREYPKTMLKAADEAYVKDWYRRNAMTDDKGATYYRGTAPLPGALVPMLDRSGEPIIVHDATEEANFAARHPAAITTIEVEVPQHTADELAQLRADNERMKAMIAERDAAKAEVAAQPVATVVAAEAKPPEAAKHHGKTKLAVPD